MILPFPDGSQQAVEGMELFVTLQVPETNPYLNLPVIQGFPQDGSRETLLEVDSPDLPVERVDGSLPSRHGCFVALDDQFLEPLNPYGDSNSDQGGDRPIFRGNRCCRNND